ncbi:MAG TPA: hypothetical protein VFO67_12600 [Gemmatimonadales bacterium]|nr:hypothetical protein [Gemmatimonadales bacterium]
MRVLGLTLVIVFGWTVSGAEASCSGSGQTWNCTAGTTPAQINAAIASASDGATFTFAAGSYTWGGGTVIAPPLDKGISLVCESQGACDVFYSGGFPGVWRPGCCTGGSSSRFYRISGFHFTAGTGATIWFAWDDSPETTLSQLRVDHNTWTLGDDDIWMLTSNRTALYLYGVIDHNVITAASMANTIAFQYTAGYDSSSPPLNRMGTDRNLFVEDNVITSTVGGGAGCLDAFGTSTGWVWRFNTITNCRLTTHGVMHSWGPSNVEYYGNRLIYNASATFPDGFRAIHHQGSGQFGFWKNSFTSASPLGDAMAVLHYRSFQPAGAPACNGTNSLDGNRSPSSTYLGYPCFHQPGRDLDGLLYPGFAFLNVNAATNAKVDLEINGSGSGPPDYTNTHFKFDRDVYNAVGASAQSSSTSPFNGTTGIGHGTLANRPATCTTTTEAADAGRGGVLYWATDQGNWNSSTSNPNGVQQNGADGVLYMCTATNTWSVYYAPYAYPHPLQSGGAPPGGGGGGVPSAPSNLRIVP